MANSQLNNTAFNQSLAGYNANRSAFESDRGFEYGKYSDMVNWTGNIPGGQGAAAQGGQQGLSAQGAGAQGAGNTAGLRTLAGQQLDYSKQTDQRDYERGVLESDRSYEYTQGRDKISDDRWQTEFDRVLKQDGIQNALSWAQNSISKQNANTSSSSAAWARDPSNPDNIYKNAQIEGAKNSSSEKLEKEKQGLVNAFRAGKMTPAQARNQIIEDTQLGFYTEAEAKEMNDALNILTGMSNQTSNPLQFYGSGGVLNQLK